MQDLIIYDALSITSKIHQPADFIDMLGLQDAKWQTIHGTKGFAYRMYFESISIHFCRDDDCIWLEMMGQGCRAFETYGTGDYESLFNLVKDNPDQVNITRLDIAFDDHSGVLDINQLCDDTRNLRFVSRFKEWQVVEGSKGCSVNHGSLSSEIYLRIYDKAKERGLTDDTHWIRVELQLRRDRARQFINGTGEVGLRFSGVLLNYVRYVQESEDSNRWRWNLLPYWNDLIANAVAISLYVKPGTEYNIFNMTDYVFKQAGNAIEATIKIIGIDEFVKRLRERGTQQNPKYIEIIEKAKRGEI